MYVWKSSVEVTLALLTITSNDSPGGWCFPSLKFWTLSHVSTDGEEFCPRVIIPRVSLIPDFSDLDNEIWDFWSDKTDDKILDLSWCCNDLRIWGSLGPGDCILHVGWVRIFGSLRQTVVDWIVNSPPKMSILSTPGPPRQPLFYSWSL